TCASVVHVDMSVVATSPPASMPLNIFRLPVIRSSKATTHRKVGAGVISTRRFSNLTTRRSSSAQYRGSFDDAKHQLYHKSPRAEVPPIRIVAETFRRYQTCKPLSVRIFSLRQ